MYIGLLANVPEGENDLKFGFLISNIVHRLCSYTCPRVQENKTQRYYSWLERKGKYKSVSQLGQTNCLLQNFTLVRKHGAAEISDQSVPEAFLTTSAHHRQRSKCILKNPQFLVKDIWSETPPQSSLHLFWLAQCFASNTGLRSLQLKVAN